MWLQCASRTVLGLVIGTVLLLTVSVLYDLADELMQPDDCSDDGPVGHEYTLDGCKLVYC